MLGLTAAAVAKRKQRRNTTQSTITQYMNKNGNGVGKRKRDQKKYNDTNRENANDSEGGQETKRQKWEKPRQTEVAERKGIG